MQNWPKIPTRLPVSRSAATIFAAWFFTTHEKRIRHEYTGYRGEARVNNYLAADLLLNELGVEADGRERVLDFVR